MESDCGGVTWLSRPLSRHQVHLFFSQSPRTIKIGLLGFRLQVVIKWPRSYIYLDFKLSLKLKKDSF